MPLRVTFPRIVEVLSTITIIFFSTVGASADDVVINKRYPVSTKDLSPPNVEATNECAVAVYVDGFVPHATVTVYVNGAKDVAIAPEFGFAAVPLMHALHTSDKVTATQTVNGVTSKPSAPMTAGAMSTHLTPPTVTPPIYACGQVVPVNGLTSGVKVEVRDATAGSIIGNGATPNDWGNDWAPV